MDCGAPGRVTAVAFDEELIISGCSQGTVKLWSMDELKLSKTLRHHTDTVSAAALLPSGLPISGSKDGTVCIWDPAAPNSPLVVLQHGAPVHAMQLQEDRGGSCSCCLSQVGAPFATEPHHWLGSCGSLDGLSWPPCVALHSAHRCSVAGAFSQQHGATVSYSALNKAPPALVAVVALALDHSCGARCGRETVSRAVLSFCCLAGQLITSSNSLGVWDLNTTQLLFSLQAPAGLARLSSSGASTSSLSTAAAAAAAGLAAGSTAAGAAAAAAQAGVDRAGDGLDGADADAADGVLLHAGWLLDEDSSSDEEGDGPGVAGAAGVIGGTLGGDGKPFTCVSCHGNLVAAGA